MAKKLSTEELTISTTGGYVARYKSKKRMRKKSTGPKKSTRTKSIALKKPLVSRKSTKMKKFSIKKKLVVQ